MSDQGPDRGSRKPGDRHPRRVSRSPDGLLGWLRWVARTDHPTVTFLREIVASVVAVVLVGLILFAVSGIWPPLVAVESASMEPHMFRGDLVFVMEEHRLAPGFATAGTGVVTYHEAADREAYRKFGDYGDVIIFLPDGHGGTPIIHRARFWVDDGENWVQQADPSYLPSTNCGQLPNCPAPHAGFITKGDANGVYDQVAGGNGDSGRSEISGPVRPAWIRGTAEVRIPWLGYVRLYFSEFNAEAEAIATVSGGVPAPAAA